MVGACLQPKMLIGCCISIALLIAIASSVALAEALRAGNASDPSTVAEARADSLLTLDDLLHAESPGDAWFSPDGERVLYTRQRSAVEVIDRSYDDPGMTNLRLYVFERRTGRTQEIVPPENATLSSIFSETPWDPRGRGLLLMCVSDGAYRLGYWSISTRKVTLLPGNPSSRGPLLAWIGDRVVYAVAADEQRQTLANASLLEGAGRRWRQAWTGTEAAVTISSVNPLFPTTKPPEGVLMLADLNGYGVKISSGDFRALEVSPDERYLAAVRLAEEDPQSLAGLGRGELQIFAIENGRARLLQTYANLDVQATRNFGSGFPALAWSPCSERLLVGGKRTGEPRERGRPLEIRVANGAVHESPTGDLQFVDPDLVAFRAMLPLGWLDANPLVIAARREPAAVPTRLLGFGLDYGERKGLRFDLFLLTRHGPQNLTAFSKTGARSFVVRRTGRAIVVADDALWEIASGRSPRRLSDSSLDVVLGFSLDPRPTSLMRSAYHHSGSIERVALLTARDMAVRRVVFDLKQLRPVDVRNWEEVLATSPDLLSTVTQESQGWCARVVLHDDGREYVLTQTNEALRRKAIAPATKFQYRHADSDLIGWYVTPPMAPKNRPLPAIVVVYGGEILGERPPAWASAIPSPPVFSGQLLAGQGYVVIYPSLPLESGHASDAMAVLAEETIAAVDALAAQGIVDSARVAVIGQSFGGWSAAAILASRSDRFRAGVAMAGMYDFAHTYGTVSMADLLTDDGRFHGESTSLMEDGYLRLGPPWKDPDAYQRNSPIYHADRMDAPLLMLAGDLDIGATGLAGATRMYNALVRAGKRPVLARYWGEGHVAQSPAAWRDQWYRVSTWFDHYLKH